MMIDKISRNILLASGKYNEELNYWQEKLVGMSMTRIPNDATVLRAGENEWQTLSNVLPEAVVQSLTKIGGKSNATKYAILVAGVKLLLFKYTRHLDLTVGMPALVQPEQSTDNPQHYALRTQLEANGTFKEWLLAVRDTISEARKSANLSYESIADLVQGVGLENESLFGMVVSCPQLHGTAPENYASYTNLLFAFDIKPDRVQLDLSYDARLYHAETIERMAGHLAQLLQTVLTDLDVAVTDVELLTEAEKQQLLFGFNDTYADYPRDRTMVELFEAQVLQQPDTTAALFGEEKLTYRELNEKANQLARILRSKGVHQDTIVGVFADRSLEMMVSLLAIMKAGGAYLPIHPMFPNDRIAYMLEDSQAPLLLTQSRYLERIEFAGEILDLENEALYQGDKSNLEPVHNGQHLAYVIYTSGTTGKPKGTLLEHQSLVNRLNWMQKCYPIGAGDVILQKTPFTFDVSVWELFWWSFTGASVAFLEVDGEKDPASIVAAIERYSVHTMHFVPSMLHAFLEYLEGRNELGKLASLRQVFASGEALNPQQVMRFNRLFAGTETRLINLYGPTEATIDVTYFNCYGQESFDVIPIGKPIDNTSLYILDENRKLLPLGAEGELYLAGDGLARGYLNKPELTDEKFVPNPFVPGTRMYRTGDLARWRADGNVEYLGRIDHQVKIRGYRIELGEIESQLLKNEAIKEAVVMARTDAQGSPYLCAYVVSKEPLQASDLQAELAETMPDYMVPPTFVFMDVIPLSAHGKADRKALPEPTLQQTTTAVYVAPQNEQETNMVRLWEEVLGKDGIGIDHNFFDLGGNSLKAIALLTKVHQEFEVDIRLGQVFKTPTIRELVAHLNGSTKSEYQRVERATEKEYYVLSSAQKGLLVQESYQELDTTYNMPRVMLAEGALDPRRFEAIMTTLIQRHEALRTSYHFRNGEWVQQVHEQVAFAVPVQDALEADVPALVDQFIRPFDLQQAPLVRLELLRITPERHIVLFDMHHSVADGESLDMFLREFELLYCGEELPERTIQYKDYAEWQHGTTQQENMRQQERYWLEVLAGDLPVLELPLDYTRPAVKSFEGDEISFAIDNELLSKLKALMAETGATMYMLLLAAYNVLLAKYSGQEEHLVGTPIAGRSHGDLQDVMGMFVNMLVLRNRPAREKTFRAFLEEVREHALQAFENQDYQFEELVGQLNVRRDWSRNPVFDTMFIMQNGPVVPELLLGDLRLAPCDFDHRTSKFDVKLEAFEQEAGIHFNLEYSTRLFKQATVERMAQHFVGLLQAIVEQPDAKLAELDMMTEEEQRQILLDFNNTDADYPKQQTIIELFETQVEQRPEQIALQQGDRKLTYGEVNARANQLARVLREKGVGTEKVVAVMLERSLEMMISLLAILKAGGAYMPIQPTFPTERIRYMLEDSGAAILLTRADLVASVAFAGATLDVEADTLYTGSRENLAPLAGVHDLAYVIYTSGTTGRPKGTMIEHGSLVGRLYWLQQQHPIGPDDVILQKTPFTFDVSLMELFGWVMSGAKLSFLEVDGEKDPARLVEAITGDQITTIHFVPSLFYVFLDHVEQRAEARSKVSSLRHVFTCGEALSQSAVDQFYRIFPQEQVRLINLYGPTEATILVSDYACAPNEEMRIVSIGKPVDNVKMYVLDREHQLQPVGVVGELYLGGHGLARGYLNLPELTAERFVADPYQPGGRMYRTGDLVRYMPDGNLEYLGRTDHQVKVRGYRIELGEIESELLQHPQISKVAVIAPEDGHGDKFLCAYVVSSSDVDQTELREHLAKTLPSYMIPAHFVKLEQMPLSASGKLDRKSLPLPTEGLSVTTAYAPPQTEREARLVSYWEEVLGRGPVGIDDDFFDQGGHSLKAATLVSILFREEQVEVSLRDFFQHLTIRQLAAFMESVQQSQYESITKAEEKAYYPVSAAQKRLYLIDQIEGPSITYNMFGAVTVQGQLDVQKVEATFQQLVQRHEILRTSIHLENGEPVQKVHDHIEFHIERMERTAGPEQAQIARFIRPFDFATAPLLRVGLLNTGPGRHVLMYDMHHIASDGISINLLLKEFLALYRGEQLPELRIQYKDYSEWQQSTSRQEALQRQEQHWLNVLQGELPVLDLPYDEPRPLVQSYEGDKIGFQVDRELTARLYELGTATGTTLFMVLLATYNVLLAKYTGQQDIIVGTTIAGRSHADLQNVMGMFVNTLPMRNTPQREKTFHQFLQDVREQVFLAFENQDYSFDELVDKLQIRRDWSRNPVFDTMFILQNGHDAVALEIDGLTLIPYEVQQKTSKFDLQLEAVEKQDTLQFHLEFSTKLFHKGTIERLSHHFVRLLQAVVEHPEAKLSELVMITEAEQQQILNGFNQTDMEYPSDRTLVELFEAQVEQTPDQVAVQCGTRELTYREVNERANQLARLLREKGIGAEHIVAVMLERSLDMMIALLGIFKAGGAYLPIQPSFPADRIRFMLEDSGTQLLLMDAKYAGTVEWSGEILHVNDASLYRGESSNLQLIHRPNNLAYVMYTSGTTGRPKGTMIEHDALLQRMYWMQRQYPVGPSDVILQKTPFIFDVSLFELFGWAFTGAKLSFLEVDGEKDPATIVEAIERDQVTTMYFVPSLLHVFMEYVESRSECVDQLSSLRRVFACGEALSQKAVDQFYRLFANARVQLFNLYGPTEATIIVTDYLCASGEQKAIALIGKPIDNVSLYVLDEARRLQPIGVTGELYIAGGLARGYLNQLELTNERFVPDPYQPGRLLYRTGDLARWLPDGNVEYQGRTDHQVKVRGYRIELGEVENQLRKLPAVKEAVVVKQVDSTGDASLCAAIVGREALTPAGIREMLAAVLPDYMIPTHFLFLDQIPIGASGKADHKAILALQPSVHRVEFEEITDEFEQKLASIWQDLLGIERVGAHDNFFDLGGTSIKMITLSLRIFQELGVNLSMRDLIDNATLRQMAAYLKSMMSIQEYGSFLFETRTLLNAEHSQQVFAFPGIGGYSVVFARLASFLTDTSVYGFDFIEGEADVFAEYARQILEVQPQGPYVLLGYSAGGSLAYGVAGKLIEMGHEVSDLIMLDSIPIPQSTTLGEEEENQAEVIRAEVLNFLEENHGVTLQAQVLDSIVNMAVEKRAAYTEFLLGMEFDRAISSNIHLIESAVEPLPKDWTPFTSGAYRIYEGSGTHELMLNDPIHSEQNAALLSDILMRIWASKHDTQTMEEPV